MSRHSWLEIERHLREAVSSVDGIIPKEDGKLVNEFIENREYGVALDWLLTTKNERNIVFPDHISQALFKVTELMNMADDFRLR